METHEGFERPSPSEAAAALAAARQARAAGHTPIPAWFFLLYGLMAAVFVLAAQLPDAVGLAAIAAYTVGMVLAQCLYNRRVDRAGIVPRSLTKGQMVLILAPPVALGTVGAFLDERWTWVWVAAAVLGGCWTVGYGLVHNRRARTFS